MENITAQQFRRLAAPISFMGTGMVVQKIISLMVGAPLVQGAIFGLSLYMAFVLGKRAFLHQKATARFDIIDQNISSGIKEIETDKLKKKLLYEVSEILFKEGYKLVVAHHDFVVHTDKNGSHTMRRQKVEELNTHPKFRGETVAITDRVGDIFQLLNQDGTPFMVTPKNGEPRHPVFIDLDNTKKNLFLDGNLIDNGYWMVEEEAELDRLQGLVISSLQSFSNGVSEINTTFASLPTRKNIGLSRL